MMSALVQQVNLYQIPPRRQCRTFFIVLSLGVLSIFILAGCLYTYAQLSQRQEALLNKQQKLTKLNTQVQKIIQDKSTGDDLLTKMALLNKQIDQVEQTTDTIENILYTYAHQYSSYLQLFQADPTTGLWFVEIKMANSEKSMILKGRSRTMTLIGLMIDKLVNEPMLSTIEFNQFQIVNPKPDVFPQSVEANTDLSEVTPLSFILSTSK